MPLGPSRRCGPPSSSDRSPSLLSQHALRRARAVAAAVSVIVVIDPLVGLLAGVTWFGEHVVVTPLSLSTALVAAVAVVVGIVLGHTEPATPPEHRAGGIEARLGRGHDVGRGTPGP